MAHAKKRPSSDGRRHGISPRLAGESHPHGGESLRTVQYPRVCSSSFPYIATDFSTLPVSPPSSWMLATIPLLQNLNRHSPDGSIAERKVAPFRPRPQC
jgi:hypothetical protein